MELIVYFIKEIWLIILWILGFWKCDGCKKWYWITSKQNKTKPKYISLGTLGDIVYEFTFIRKCKNCI